MNAGRVRLGRRGRPVSVIGSTQDASGAVELIDEPDGGVHVTTFATTDGTLNGLVALGATKVANRLRPLVDGQATLDDAADVLRGLGPHPAADLMGRA